MCTVAFNFLSFATRVYQLYSNSEHYCTTIVLLLQDTTNLLTIEMISRSKQGTVEISRTKLEGYCLVRYICLTRVVEWTARIARSPFYYSSKANVLDQAVAF